MFLLDENRADDDVAEITIVMKTKILKYNEVIVYVIHIFSCKFRWQS